MWLERRVSQEAGCIMGWTVTVLPGPMELRLHLAEQGAHEDIREQDDRATFVH